MEGVVEVGVAVRAGERSRRHVRGERPIRQVVPAVAHVGEVQGLLPGQALGDGQAPRPRPGKVDRARVDRVHVARPQVRPRVDRGQAAEGQAPGHVVVVRVRVVDVRRHGPGEVLVVPLGPVVEEAAPAPEHQVAVAPHAPGEVEARHEGDARAAGHALRDIPPAREEDAVGARGIAVDERALCRVVGGRVEQGAEAVELLVVDRAWPRAARPRASGSDAPSRSPGRSPRSSRSATPCPGRAFPASTGRASRREGRRSRCRCRPASRGSPRRAARSG